MARMSLFGLAGLMLAFSAAGPARAPKSGAALAKDGACVAPVRGLALGFAAEFAGVSPEDSQSNLWTGTVSGPVSGDLVMTLEFLGELMALANPVWNVRTRWQVTADRPPSSFTAELYGTVDWKTGVFRLSGVVTQGVHKGHVVNADGRFADLDGSGVLEIHPPIAVR